MSEALLELETLLGLAGLESHARLSDILALHKVAVQWEEARDDCLAGVRFMLGAGEEPSPRFSSDSLEMAVRQALSLITRNGLQSMSIRELIDLFNNLLTNLEDSRRAKRKNAPVELSVFVMLEAVKAVMFGRNLNIAERSGLRGLYQRERLLQQI